MHLWWCTSRKCTNAYQLKLQIAITFIILITQQNNHKRHSDTSTLAVHNLTGVAGIPSFQLYKLGNNHVSDSERCEEYMLDCTLDTWIGMRFWQNLTALYTVGTPANHNHLVCVTMLPQELTDWHLPAVCEPQIQHGSPRYGCVVATTIWKCLLVWGATTRIHRGILIFQSIFYARQKFFCRRCWAYIRLTNLPLPWLQCTCVSRCCCIP